MTCEALVSVRNARNTLAGVIAPLLLAVMSNPIIGQRGAVHAQSTGGFQFDVSFPASVSPDRQDGHIILIVSRDTSREPRFQYQVYNPGVQPAFGLDVDGLAPGATAVIDSKVFGWPLRSVMDIPAGERIAKAG